MPKWKTWPGEVSVPSVLDEAQLNTLKTFLTNYKDTLDATQEVVDAVAQVAAFQEANNPLGAGLAFFGDTLKAYITDILNTGVYAFPILPGPGITGYVQPFTTTQALQRVSESLSDRMDSERPQSSASAGYAAVVFLGGVNEFPNFVTLYNAIANLLGDQSRWAKIGEILSSLAFQTSKPERGHRNSEGAPYDWYSFRVEQIGAVESALLKAKSVISSLLLSGMSPLTDVVKTLRRRVEYYLEVTNELLEFLRFFENLSTLAASLKVLPLQATTGGVAQMQVDIINNVADGPGSNWPDFKYCVGFVLAGVFPDGSDAASGLASFKTFLTLLGVALDAWGSPGEGVLIT